MRNYWRRFWIGKVSRAVEVQGPQRAFAFLWFAIGSYHADLHWGARARRAIGAI